MMVRFVQSYWPIEYSTVIQSVSFDKKIYNITLFEINIVIIQLKVSSPNVGLLYLYIKVIKYLPILSSSRIKIFIKLLL